MAFREHAQQILQRDRRAQPAPVVAAEQVFSGDRGVVPHQPERCLCAEPAAEAVVEGVEVPAEISGRPVDGLTDRAVEPSMSVTNRPSR
jgi:hypothetical protein